MEEEERLKEKIEELREQLDQAIRDDLSRQIVYDRSLALDGVMGQYLDIVAEKE